MIIGFGGFEAAKKLIYDYDQDGKATVFEAKAISPYLIDGPEGALTNRSQPICSAPKIGIGNKPIDNGNYLFTPQEKDEFLVKEPGAKRFFRRWVGSEEFINGIERWCLWLGDCRPEELSSLPESIKRVQAVQEYRLKSKSAPTRKLASTPTRFHVEKFPATEYLVVPSVSSERREYIPIGFEGPSTLISNLCLVVETTEFYDFGVLTSAMHMAWVRQVCGRLKSDFRYSALLVYNNYPWPQDVTEKQRSAVDSAAGAVLEVRDKYMPKSSYADLYGPLTMPPDLRDAHTALDRAVDACYRKAPFSNDRERVEFLFKLYESLASPLTAPMKKRGG